MIKLITPGSYDFGEPAISMVPWSSRGIVGADKHGFLKRASHLFLEKLADFRPMPGEIPVHIVAIGASEAFGPNRNGDAFSADVCEKYAHTFENAMYFRSHQNKDRRKSYGQVKHAAYNPAMQRIELIATLNATKEAAARNGGLIADMELEKLGRGEDVPTSMGTHVPYDSCSGCGHRARFRKEYCDDDECAKYGGLRNNIGRTFQDGHTLHAINPCANWFDISTVGRNADRISFNLGMIDKYAAMLKAAEHQKISGAAWAEECDVSAPSWLLVHNDPWMSPKLKQMLKVAGMMIGAEDRMQQQKLGSNLLAFCDGARAQVPMPDVRRGREKLGAVLAATHEQRCLLPLTAFMELVSGEPREKIAGYAPLVSAALPGAANRLVSDTTFEQQLLQNPYTGSLSPSMQTRAWVAKYAADWSLHPTRVVERSQLAVIRGVQPPPMMKTASYTRSADAMAREYVLYEIAFLAAQPEDALLQRTVDYVVQHNYAQ